MTDAIIAAIEKGFSDLLAKLTPTAKKVESEVLAIGTSSLSYIETNGLHDLYKIATSALIGAATGQPWATTMATVVEQGKQAGIAIAEGAEAIVLAQAQADLMAAGMLTSPTGATISATVAAPVAAVTTTAAATV